MQYLILKHTPYEYINDSYDIVSATDNFDEATNKVQGYRMINEDKSCLLYTSPSPRDRQKSRMPSSA